MTQERCAQHFPATELCWSVYVVCVSSGQMRYCKARNARSIQRVNADVCEASPAGKVRCRSHGMWTTWARHCLPAHRMSMQQSLVALPSGLLNRKCVSVGFGV